MACTVRPAERSIGCCCCCCVCCGDCCAVVDAVPELVDEVGGPMVAGLGVGTDGEEGCAFAGAGRE